MRFESDKHAGREGAPQAAAPDASADASDADLVEAARNLDEAAWTELYRRHARQVYAYIYFRVGDQHTAEDLAADVFVRAIASIGGYTWRGTPLLAWLYRIAHNVTVDHRRAVGQRARHAANGAVDVQDSFDAIAASEDHSDMMQAVRSLTDEQQQVVILRFYQGLGSADVAAVMGKPEGAVKALQTRALRSLRRYLTQRRGAA